MNNKVNVAGMSMTVLKDRWINWDVSGKLYWYADTDSITHVKPNEQVIHIPIPTLSDKATKVDITKVIAKELWKIVFNQPKGLAMYVPEVNNTTRDIANYCIQNGIVCKIYLPLETITVKPEANLTIHPYFKTFKVEDTNYTNSITNPEAIEKIKLAQQHLESARKELQSQTWDLVKQSPELQLVNKYHREYLSEQKEIATKTARYYDTKNLLEDQWITENMFLPYTTKYGKKVPMNVWHYQQDSRLKTKLLKTLKEESRAYGFNLKLEETPKDQLLIADTRNAYGYSKTISSQTEVWESSTIYDYPERVQKADLTRFRNIVNGLDISSDKELLEAMICIKWYKDNGIEKEMLDEDFTTCNKCKRPLMIPSSVDVLADIENINGQYQTWHYCEVCQTFEDQLSQMVRV